LVSCDVAADELVILFALRVVLAIPVLSHSRQCQPCDVKWKQVAEPHTGFSAIKHGQSYLLAFAKLTLLALVRIEGNLTRRCGVHSPLSQNVKSYDYGSVTV
jgi:hypothetical protein